MTEHTVLIVGAGPTGLTLACELARRNVDHMIIDGKSGPSTEPKALVLWSAAQESLRILGVDPAVFDAGVTLDRASYWSKGSQIGHVDFTGLDQPGLHKPLSLPQPLVEAALLELYQALGGTVRWRHKFLGALDPDPAGPSDGARASLVGPSGIRFTTTAEWIVGTDGAHSTVRKTAAIDFDGDSYDDAFLLVDGTLETDGSVGEAQYHLHPDGVTVVVPLPGGGHRVFLGHRQSASPALIPPTQITDRANIMLGQRGLGRFRVSNVLWQSDFRVHRRLSSRYVSGRFILAGDAAHIHSPAGGQGMNTGIQDAANLAWKLAAVAVDGADAALLETYELERRPVAESVAAMTDLQTKLWTTRAAVSRWIRDRILGILSATGLLTRRVVPQLAQIDTAYGPSVARGGGRGRTISPGKFLPPHPVQFDGEVDKLLPDLLDDRRVLALATITSIDELRALHAILDSWGSRLHVVVVVHSPTTLLSATPTVIDTHEIVSSELGQGGVAVVRPDRIVGMTGSLQNPAAIRTYLTAVAGPADTQAVERGRPETSASKETAS
ncbi:MULTISPECIES: FAD-dependent monooxygenase [Nocardiaceae]|uniref:Putative FAD-binding monooxygenase n=1 Tax=Rhodococcoides fascians D188 TaxID=1051973 RepID=G8JYS2_RHOFA|nr:MULTISPECIES: FAD-dependent monooxygenase [Rhodococcus]AET25193.1 putative FAD-binding monooxygenase [Rhodococcus fascians D188]AMY56220.1 Pentachlorophenol 4-monooxygenase [Rhodococcus fascians D188]OZC43731.1 hypothetical protein CH289_26380 [Rhodococcus sp. RS1C4]OZC51364.1 hypothetical protein CH267_21195 [Rhodococcus sp. 06-621-2]OZC60783.1 hypothetical protein CH277_27430 [Rhodococcus sp. 06-469-3-2]